MTNVMKTLFCLLALAVAMPARAQSTTAIQSFSPLGEGIAWGTSGWTFQPLTNVAVTALGCWEETISGEPAPICVGLWAADGTLLASNTVSTNSTLTNEFWYEPINPVLLFTNQTYYLGAASPPGPIIIGAFAPGGGSGFVNMAPEIQLGMAVISTEVATTNQSLDFPEYMEYGPDSLFVGPSFQFQDGILPPVLNISPASNAVLISWSATYPNLVLQENNDLTTTNWLTTTNPVVPVGGQNQVLISSPWGNNFYRLESP